MKKYIRFVTGETMELSPITYEEFVLNGEWVGSSDMAYLKFLNINNFVCLSDFDDDVLERADLFFVRGEPSLGLK